LLLSKGENAFIYERFNGRYNLAGDWIAETLSPQDQQQLDESFALFIKRLRELIQIETGLPLEAKQDLLIEV
jgi:sigma factor-binding protein Crl